jgi:hypothetical protein
MPCIFCIAALAIAATTIVPALLDQMEGSLAKISADLQRTAESESMVQWGGSFAFRDSGGHQRTAAANITLYKDSKRARIQVMTHQLDPQSDELLEDTIAAALGAKVLSRHRPTAFEPAHHHDVAMPGAEPIRTPPRERA